MDKRTALTLTRQTRLYLPLGSEPEQDHPAHENRWHAWGEIRPWATYVMIETSVKGCVDPLVGYLLDIRTMDRFLVSACRDVQRHIAWPTDNRDRAWGSLQNFAACVWNNLEIVYSRASDSKLPLQLTQMVWRLTPQMAITLGHKTPHCYGQHFISKVGDMNTDPEQDQAQTEPHTHNEKLPVTQSMTMQYEFAAAHRLHCASWTEAENRDAFGKCNHPSGHGHNYLLEVTVGWPNVSGNTKVPNPSPYENLPQFVNPIVHTHVLNKLDHRFLNLDVVEFRELNPTVENIAQVIFDWLDQVIPAELQLRSVKIYETAKTWAEVQRVY